MNEMLLKAEVESDFVDERSGVNAKGKDWSIRSQEVWVYLGSKFPEKVTLTLEGRQLPYRPGLYEFDLIPALRVGDFGRLEIDGRKLRLIATPVAAAKAG